MDTLISTIKTYLNEGMMYYPKDQMTDHPERFVMAEFIREKILILQEKKFLIVLQSLLKEWQN